MTVQIFLFLVLLQKGFSLGEASDGKLVLVKARATSPEALDDFVAFLDGNFGESSVTAMETVWYLKDIFRKRR
jgi:hypothetical protein